MSVAAEFQQECIEMERRNQMSFIEWQKELLSDPVLVHDVFTDEIEATTKLFKYFLTKEKDYASIGLLFVSVFSEVIETKTKEIMEEFKHEYEAFQAGY